jgi:hypothetical protein
MIFASSLWKHPQPDEDETKVTANGAKDCVSSEIERAYVDKGYRALDTENPRRVFISGQKRGFFGITKSPD